MPRHLQRVGFVRLLLMFVAASSVAAGVRDVHAQTQAASLSESQRQLNDQGVQAIIEEDFDKAIRLFQSSLALGEVNVTYLNLGRAYAKNGDCQEARDAYAKTRQAAPVALPTPEEVIQVLLRYESELEQTPCPARLSIICRPKAMRVSVDGDEAAACPREAIKLEAGEHTITGQHDGQTVSRTVLVEAAEAQELALEIVVAEVGETAPQVTRQRASSPYPLWAWVTGGTGAAMLVTGLIVDLAVIGPKIADWKEDGRPTDERRSIETLQDLNLALFIGGGVLVATSVVLLLLPWDDGGQDALSETSSLEVVLGPDRAAMLWTLRW